VPKHPDPKANGQANSAQQRKHTSFEYLAGFIGLLAFFAAAGQAYIANDTEKRSLRAYVFLVGGTIVLDGLTLKTVMDLKNGGQTPAYDLTVKSWMEINARGEPFDPKLAPTSYAGQIDRAILGSQAIVNPRLALAAPPEYIPPLKNGPGIIFVIGQVEYRDAFDRVWLLDFRWRSHVFENGRWQVRPAEEGNRESQKPYSPTYRTMAKTSRAP
jgi:hypothetical protein